MTLFLTSVSATFPVLSSFMTAVRVSLSSPSTRLQQPLDMLSGSIGNTTFGKYTLVVRSKASRSTALPGLTKCETSAI